MLTAIATDAAGNSATSSGVSVTVYNPYITGFPLNENPISSWQLDKRPDRRPRLDQRPDSLGLSVWNRIRFSDFDDSTAVLAGAWSPDQVVQATVFAQNQPTDPSIYEEVELRLRTTIGPHSITGYEINFSCSANPDNSYAEIVAWNAHLRQLHTARRNNPS